MKTVIRKSHTAEQQIYFWTATINQWQNLLVEDDFKQVIISSLQNLSERQLITIYAFVIMPNHLHLIWRLDAPNGRESAKGSFLKFTAHEFKRRLKASGNLEHYKVNAANKQYEFWKRDSLGIAIWSRNVAQQKLDYIHANPVTGKWLLAKDDISYRWSSARFYEFGEDEFGFLKNLFWEFDGD